MAIVALFLQTPCKITSSVPWRRYLSRFELASNYKRRQTISPDLLNELSSKPAIAISNSVYNCVANCIATPLTSSTIPALANPKNPCGPNSSYRPIGMWGIAGALLSQGQITSALAPLQIHLDGSFNPAVSSKAVLTISNLWISCILRYRGCWAAPTLSISAFQCSKSPLPAYRILVWARNYQALIADSCSRN